MLSNKWQQIENNTVSTVSELSLPNTIAKNFFNVVPFVVLNWIRYHDAQLILNICTYSAVDYINNIV